MKNLVFLLLFLSGATGLIYQVTWQKYLAILLGSHASSTAAILSLFFVFLSLGYLVIGRYAMSLMKNQLLLYGVIELLIGIYALYSPALFEGVFHYFVAQVGSGGGIFFALLICGLFIGFPTFLMGGTIPVLTQALSEAFEESGDIHAKVYGVNTLGAVFGCALAGYYLIEALGLADTLLLAGNLNILIFFASLWIIKKSQLDFSGPELEASLAPQVSGRHWLYLVSFLSGFYTFGFETLIIKMAGISIGSTSYTYSTVVSAFIVAIAIGSLVIARSKRAQNPSFLNFTLGITFISMFFVYLSVPHWPLWFHRILSIFNPTYFNVGLYHATQFVALVLILVIPVAFIGSNLPILFNIVQARDANLSKIVGRLYAVNAVGSAIGALFIGYLIYDYLEASQAFKLCIVAVVLALLLGSGIVSQGSERWRTWAGAALALLLVVSIGNWDHRSFTPGQRMRGPVPNTEEDFWRYQEQKAYKGELLFSRFDANTHASVIKYNEVRFSLLVNGKPDAVTGPQSDAETRAMAALTPMMIKPDPVKKVFIIGLGGGLSTGLFAGFPEVEKVKVAEISKGVVEAQEYLHQFNYAYKEQQNKIEIEVGDAYRQLMVDPGGYDLVVSEPSNPWLMGSEKIFTQEFYELAKSKMNEGGYYVQWFPIFYMPAKTFKKVLATFRSVFSNTVVFSTTGGALTVIGSERPIQLNEEVSRARYESYSKPYKDFGYSDPISVWLKQLANPLQVDLIAYGQEEFHSLYTPDLEYKSGRAFFAGDNTNMSEVLLESAVLPAPKDMLAQRGGFLFEQSKKKPEEKNFKEAWLTSKSPNYWPHFETFLIVQRLKRFPNSKRLDPKRATVPEIKYLMGLTERVSDEALDAPGFESLTRIFRTMNALGENPPFRKLMPFVETACPGKDCAEFMGLVLLNLGPRELAVELRKKTKPDLVESELRPEFEKLVATYKRIGAF